MVAGEEGDMVPDESHESSRARMTVAEAARALGISESAVRQRVKRGELEHGRTPDGRLTVYLNSADTSATSRDESYEARTERYVRSLEDRIEYLRNELDQEREANRENGLIITALRERITELEASLAAAVEPESREPDLASAGPDVPDEGDKHLRAPSAPDDTDDDAVLKNDAVLVQFFITAGASIAAAAVLAFSVLNGHVVLAGLAGVITLLSIAGFLSHWWLFRVGTDRIQGRPSEPRSEASAGRQEVQAAKKKLPLPLDFLLQLLVCVALVFGVVKPFVVEPFYIPSESMVPTLEAGDRVLANKFVYRFEEPSRGDIVIFNAAEGNPHETLIKRVIGLPGNKIELRHGKLLLNGRLHNEPYVVNKPCVRGAPKTCSYGPVRVPKGRYFVMGDNRANSEDSRYFGPISEDDIKGKAFLRWWPPDRAGLL